MNCDLRSPLLILPVGKLPNAFQPRITAELTNGGQP